MLDEYLTEMLQAPEWNRPAIQKKWDAKGLPLSLVQEMLKEAAEDESDNS